MAYDEKLAERVRAALGGTRGVTERKMFGGLCFLHHGNMTCGIVNDTLMVRVGPEAWPGLVALPHAREMDFTGKSLKGMVYVAPEGLKGKNLATWVGRGTAFTDTLPRKPKK